MDDDAFREQERRHQEHLDMVQRLTRIEVLLANHMRHHWAWYTPIIAGLVWLIVRSYP